MYAFKLKVRKIANTPMKCIFKYEVGNAGLCQLALEQMRCNRIQSVICWLSPHLSGSYFLEIFVIIVCMTLKKEAANFFEMLVISHFNRELHPEKPSLACLKVYHKACQMHAMSKYSLDHKSSIQPVIWEICCVYKEIIFGTGQISMHQALWLAVLIFITDRFLYIVNFQ
jgi:hypothetical protein